MHQLEQTKDRPTVLIIDDIEIGLNPQCQNAFLNELTSGYPNLQIIGSTHSPFVLSGAEKTAAFNLETGQMHEHLAWMGFKEIAERVLGWWSDGLEKTRMGAMVRKFCVSTHFME